MKKNTKTIIHDHDGKVSHKRLFSTVLMISGIVMAIIAYALALFMPIGDSHLIRDLVAIILGLGSGLSGVSIFDAIIKRRKND